MNERLMRTKKNLTKNLSDAIERKISDNWIPVNFKSVSHNATYFKTKKSLARIRIWKTSYISTTYTCYILKHTKIVMLDIKSVKNYGIRVHMRHV